MAQKSKKAGGGKKRRSAVGEDGFLEEPAEEPPQNIWLPGMKLEEGEELEYDPAAYKMLHTLQTPWPCLSFDVVRDPFGMGRTQFPLQCLLVAGTTTPHPAGAQLLMLHCHDMKRTGGYSTDSESDDSGAEDGEEDGEDDREEEEEEEEDDGDGDGSKMQVDGAEDRRRSRMVQPKQDVVFAVDHPGNVNRVRVMPLVGEDVEGLPVPWVATLSDRHRVHIWQGPTMVYETPKRMYHRAEGFGLAWHRRRQAVLSGDSSGHIYMHAATGAAFDVTTAFAKVGGGIDDIDWSPTDDDVFATVGTDGQLRLWDARAPQCQSSTLLAKCDVNVLSWSVVDAALVAVGADDGSLQVVDMRMLGGEASGSVVHSNASWHRAAITALEWHPTDSLVMAASGDDDQTSVWQWGAEPVDPVRDDLRNSNVRDLKRVPPELLFVHAGQQEVRELHWHPQCPGLLLTTAASGFNMFRTINL